MGGRGWALLRIACRYVHSQCIVLDESVVVAVLNLHVRHRVTCRTAEI